MNTSHALLNKLQILKERGHLLGLAREFFRERNILEVDCPLLSSAASVDQHIDLMQTTEGRYLHSSPEYPMKRLLAEGIGDIYQLSHVFRKGEQGSKHNPEFTLVEWYRMGFSFQEMIEETSEFLELILGKHPVQQHTYQELFLQFLKIDPLTSSYELLEHTAFQNNVSLPQAYSKDDLLDLLFNACIEPHFENVYTIVYDYPASHAALAEVEGSVAKRFEIYYSRHELANGYQELRDPKEQQRRLEKANQKRAQPLPIDNNFLTALEKGIPPCCGVAVGFDRLLMLKYGIKEIAHVLPFSWSQA